MMNFANLPDDVRRAAARAELRRRGVHPVRTNASLEAAIKATLEGVKTLPGLDANGMTTTNPEHKMIALNARIVADCLTTVDRALLDSLPPFEFSPSELVGLFVEIFNEF